MMIKFGLCLITVCRPGHAAHHTENIVVHSVNIHDRAASSKILGVISSWGITGVIETNAYIKSSIINTGKVARASWLVILCSKSK